MAAEGGGAADEGGGAAAPEPTARVVTVVIALAAGTGTRDAWPEDTTCGARAASMIADDGALADGALAEGDALAAAALADTPLDGDTGVTSGPAALTLAGGGDGTDGTDTGVVRCESSFTANTPMPAHAATAAAAMPKATRRERLDVAAERGG